jgi:hypothetical protein
MIPYDDLVAALSSWRARQGLPVSTMGGASAAPKPAPKAAPQAAAVVPDSGPRSVPPKAPPPAAPRTKQPSVPPPLADAEEVDAAMLDEAHYENEGDDFAMSFGSAGAGAGAGAGGGDEGGEHEGATAIGGPPQRDTVPGKRGRNDEEW